MLVEETAAECCQPFLDGGIVKFSVKGDLRERKNLLRRESVTEQIVKEEVVQFVRTDDVFGLLLYIAILSAGISSGLIGVSTMSSNVVFAVSSSRRLAIHATRCFTSVLGTLALTPYIDMWSPL